MCFQVPDDEVTEISEATDATDISEASDQDNNKKVRTHLTCSFSLFVAKLNMFVFVHMLCRVGMWQKTLKKL